MAYLSVEEAHRRIEGCLNAFCDAVSSNDGAFLNQIFPVSSDSPALVSLSEALNLVQDVSGIVKQSDKFSEFGDILVPLFRSLQSYQQEQLLDAYNAYEKLANAFLQEFRNWDSTWALETMELITHEIRVLAEMADRESAYHKKTPNKLNGAGSFLMKVFASLAVKGPKRVGALYVACELFKIYFKLGTTHLCRSVIRSLETGRIFDFDEFPLNDKVTYMYYTGRLDVLNENFTSANEKLSFALAYCSSHSYNTRSVLKFLIPVKLSMGILPRKFLLHNYDLLEYADVVRALESGDLRLLRNTLRQHEDLFLRSGVYLVLEKLELLVYHRLVKKIYNIQKEKDTVKAHHVRLELVVMALNMMGIDMDVDEAACIMTILIHQNLIKGYFFHKTKVLVLSKQEPFPKLSGRPMTEY